ncbi:hypothetical protein [Enterocloster citroniae]|uniref:hypothetical protein n=1 Tax=Enterocloster citroniae TaxID=358743 RepID=UPI00189773DA|nr:hypothetical protein [Enterocloster citroniae]
MKQAEYKITDVYSAENFRTEGHRLIDMIAEDLESAGHREIPPFAVSILCGSL